MTAAHCLEETEGGWRLRGGGDDPTVAFGEYFRAGGASLRIPTLYCEPYPGGYRITVNGKPRYVGVDLAFCTLDGGWSGSPIPPMVVGCEADYLSDGVFSGAPPRMFAVGSGTNEYGDDDGHKRYWRTSLHPQSPMTYTGGAWKLQNDYTVPEYENTLYPGDSGGPLYVEMADGTWRLIGVFHGFFAWKSRWQPVPPYVRWLETASGYDLTPCHVWDEGAQVYVFDRFGTECTWEVGFALHPDLGEQTSWAAHCVGPEGGGLDVCAGWDPSDSSLDDLVLFPPVPGSGPEPPRLSAEPPDDTAGSCPPGTAPVLGEDRSELRVVSEPGGCHVLGDGDDLVWSFATASVSLLGAGNDLFVATQGRDLVAGSGGNDAIYAGGGDDRIYGGAGGDLLLSGPGADLVDGGSGPDALFAGEGDDTLFGGRGADVLASVDGTNVFIGGRGGDVVEGGSGMDLAVPGPGADVVSLGAGDDVVVVAAPCELVAGEVLRGGPGYDTLVLPIPLPEVESMGVGVEGFESVVVHDLGDVPGVCDPFRDLDEGLDGAGPVRSASSIVPPEDGLESAGVAVEVHDETGDVAVGLWDGSWSWSWIRVDGVVYTGDDGRAAYDRVFGPIDANDRGEEAPWCVHACCS